VYAIGVGFNQTRVAAGEVFYVGASDAAAPDLVIANASGLERVRITDAGNVGIGTSTPSATLDVAANSSSAAVRITQTGAGNSFRVDDETNPDASPFLITSTGDVGVGVTTPTAKMDVRGDVLATNGTNGARLVSSEGSLELKRSSSDAYIDFKTSAAEDADCRIAQLSNGLAFQVGGNGALVGGAAILSDANFQFNSGYGSVATAYGCRAWVNFNGTGTVAIRASGNVSSITDRGVGSYTVNFTTAMPDANYAAVGVEKWLDVQTRIAALAIDNLSTTGCEIVAMLCNSNTSTIQVAYDPTQVWMTFFR
jgi:hypothetical protein